jgi:hypothetical protein
LKQGDALSPLLFNFVLQYAVRRVQTNQEGLKLNGTHELSVYADDVNILGGSIHTIRKNREALLIASKETTEKIMYMVMSRDQNEGQSGNIQTGNKSFETVEQFTYLGTTLTNQNSIHEEIKSRLKSGNAYHSVQIKIYRTIILPVILYGCESWSLILREECWLRLFDNRVLRRIFGPKRDEVTGEWRRLHNKELYALYSSTNIIRVMR